MAWTEKPPILTGRTRDDVQALRDYLFRMAGSLEEIATAGGSGVSVKYGKDGRQILSQGNSADLAQIRQNAQELRSLILKSARDINELETETVPDGDTAVMQYVDSKTEVYNSMYVAQSEFGTFRQDLTSVIETTAQGVVESYDYGSSIESIQDSIGLLQNYYASINGEIRRGIVLDPDTGEYVTGIAISQSLQFSGECGPTDPENPGDGYTYYYMSEGQTFGLYTSTGWQFWIDGYKKGWYSSLDGMLHIANVLVENTLQIGSLWQILTSAGGEELEIRYTGG